MHLAAKYFNFREQIKLFADLKIMFWEKPYLKKRLYLALLASLPFLVFKASAFQPEK